MAPRASAPVRYGLRRAHERLDPRHPAVVARTRGSSDLTRAPARARTPVSDDPGGDRAGVPTTEDTTMNAMDRIHHVEHRRRPRGAVAFERAGSGTATSDVATVTEPRDAVPMTDPTTDRMTWSADDFAD
jgi:hypothetical protein